MIAKLLPIAVLTLLLAMPAGASFPGANGLIAFNREHGIGNLSIDVVRPDGSGRATIVVNGTSPSWSPDGKRLVFDGFRYASDDELFVVNADGSGRRQIPHPGADDFEPAWSSDGRRIAFVSRPNISAALEIYVVNANGSGRRRLTRNYMRDDSPGWSPDGTRIAFERIGSRGGIYTVRPNGKWLRRLTRARDTDPSVVLVVSGAVVFEATVVAGAATATRTLCSSPTSTRLVGERSRSKAPARSVPA